MDGWIDGLTDAWRFLIRKALLSLWLRLAKLLIMYQIKKSYHVSSQIKYWCHLVTYLYILSSNQLFFLFSKYFSQNKEKQNIFLTFSWACKKIHKIYNSVFQQQNQLFHSYHMKNINNMNTRILSVWMYITYMYMYGQNHWQNMLTQYFITQQTNCKDIYK